MGEICIQVKNISKSFAKRKVVDDLSFEVYKDEVFGLLGHNGAGKSTTIDMILGLKKCDEGSTLICNMDVIKHRKEVFEMVGVQLQNTQYPNMMKVIEVCMEYASLYEKPADYIELLKLFKLYELRNSFINKLSGGERQKLSVILALIGDPKIVFLDELTTGLDVVARKEVWDTLRHLKDKGLTIFLTTHYMEEAQALCDRICLIKAGKKVIEGSIDEVLKASGKNNLEDAYLYFM